MELKKTSKPLVSFIITCFNLPEEALRGCVDSILALSLAAREREIIMVDDGSDKCALDCLEGCRDDIVYIRQRHKGLSAARNTGIEISKGRYIQLLDGADRLAQAAYEHCLDIIRYEGDTDIVMFDPASQKAEQTVFSNSDPVNGTIYLHNNNPSSTADGYIFKKTTLGNMRFNEDMMYDDDFFTPMLILRAERVIRTDAKAVISPKPEEDGSDDKNSRKNLMRLNDIETIIFNLYDLADKLPRDERMALQTRVRQLTLDYIYDTMIHTRSEHQLNRRLNRLKKKALFPLYDKKYNSRYKTLSLLTKYKLTRKLMMSVLRFKPSAN